MSFVQSALGLDVMLLTSGLPRWFLPVPRVCDVAEWTLDGRILIAARLIYQEAGLSFVLELIIQRRKLRTGDGSHNGHHLQHPTCGPN